MENQSLLNDRLPFGNAKFFLGIASIVLSPVLVGFILGVISVYLVDKDTKMLKFRSSVYSEAAVSQHRQGVIIAWIGFGISLIVTLFIIYLFSTYGTVNFDKIKAIREQGTAA